MNQLNIFEENQKLRYKEFYNKFYSGVREKQEKINREFKSGKGVAKSISILIKPIK